VCVCEREDLFSDLILKIILKREKFVFFNSVPIE